MTARFNNYLAHITITNDYKNEMCGICGNFNGKSRDDLNNDKEQWRIPTDDEEGLVQNKS